MGVMRGIRAKTWGLLAALLFVGADSALGLQRTVQTKVANYEESPVVLRRASLRIVQTYSTPSQFPLATASDGQEVRIKRSRVRYLNRRDQQIPTYLLEGEVEIQNDARQDVVAVQISSVFFNAFRERLDTARHSITQTLASGQSKRIRWSKNLPHEDIFEVYFVLTAVRFADGTVWAPTEELVILPASR